jgi:hypothetical protein
MTVARLSAEFHRCFSHFEARPDLFASETFFDLLPPLWRFQFVGPGEAFTIQLRSIAQGPVDVDVSGPFRRPRASSPEAQHTPAEIVTARRLHLCGRDGRICAVTTYCNGAWDDELRTRHAAEAPMVQP